MIKDGAVTCCNYFKGEKPLSCFIQPSKLIVNYRSGNHRY